MNSSIDYSKIKDFLANATLYELGRFSKVLLNEINNPKRIAAVRNQFKEGDKIEYFSCKNNRVVSGIVERKTPTTVWIQNCTDGRRWTMGYERIKLDSRDFVFSQKQGKLDRNSLAIGDSVGFNHDGTQITGLIERLNGKTASLITTDRKKWRVAYAYLYFVIEGEASTSTADPTYFIEGESQ